MILCLLIVIAAVILANLCPMWRDDTGTSARLEIEGATFPVNAFTTTIGTGDVDIDLSRFGLSGTGAMAEIAYDEVTGNFSLRQVSDVEALFLLRNGEKIDMDKTDATPLVHNDVIHLAAIKRSRLADNTQRKAAALDLTFKRG